MRHIKLLIVCAFLASCTTTELTTPEGAKFRNVAFGGKGAAVANNEGVRVVWSNEKSFYHGSVLVGTIATTAASAYATAATEATKQAAAKEATKRHAAEQATQQATVKAGSDVVKHANGANTALEIPAQIVTPKGY